MRALSDPEHLCDLLEVSRGPVAQVLADLIGIAVLTTEDLLVDEGIDPALPAALVTDAEVRRLSRRLDVLARRLRV